jgi:hypothetical protein
MPSITCAAPACPAAGAVVQLAGSCSTTEANVDLMYINAADGSVVTNVTCPGNGSTVVVKVKPTRTDRPECPYDGKTAYTFNSAHRGLARRGC